MSVPMDLSMRWQVVCGDALDVLLALPDGVVQTCVTSPPYFGLRDYGCDGQIGLEPTPAEYVERLVAVFREVRRVLRDDGTLWLNLGDSYAGSGSSAGGESRHGGDVGSRALWKSDGHKRHNPPNGIKGKDLMGIPWSVAFALRSDGWFLRSDIIWAKPNPMPESVTDRPTKSHEYLFLLSKSATYHYDARAIQEDKVCFRARGAGRSKHSADRNDNGDMAHFANTDLERGVRNKRSVWTISTEPYADAHFAVMPTALVGPCVLAGCPQGGLVLDPFAGSGTVGVVSLREGCRFIGVELNPEYVALASERIGREAAQGSFGFVV